MIPVFYLEVTLQYFKIMALFKSIETLAVTEILLVEGVTAER